MPPSEKEGHRPRQEECRFMAFPPMTIGLKIHTGKEKDLL